MKKTVVQKEVFLTCDGVEFDNESEASKHEEKWSLLRDLTQAIPLSVAKNNNYETIFIKEGSLEMLRESISSAFALTNPGALMEGWNLIHDRGREAQCFSINKLFENANAPKQAVLSEGELRGVQEFKKAVFMIIKANTESPASPQATLGNMIMQLQDLLKS